MLLRFVQKPVLTIGRTFLVLMALMGSPSLVSAQKWHWTTEQIDAAGADSSLVADSQGNLHISYYFPVDGQLRYGFRGAKNSRWFKMELDHGYGDFFTQIAVDVKGNPYICYTPFILKMARFDGRHWIVERVDPTGGDIFYACSVQVGPGGAPQVSWYRDSEPVYLRYAILKDRVWVAQTADPENMPGKWHSMTLDGKGLPHLSYVTLFKWQLRYSYYDGKSWMHTVVDSPDLHHTDDQLGMGNSLALDSDGNPMISYYDLGSLKLARFVDNKWKIEVVTQFSSTGKMAGWKTYRSRIVLDGGGNPHIAFVSPRGLEHAWREGGTWRTQLVIATSGFVVFDCGMTIDTSDTLYISYTDPADKSLRLAVGRQPLVSRTVNDGKRSTLDAAGLPLPLR